MRPAPYPETLWTQPPVIGRIPIVAREPRHRGEWFGETRHGGVASSAASSEIEMMERSPITGVAKSPEREEKEHAK